MMLDLIMVAPVLEVLVIMLGVVLMVPLAVVFSVVISVVIFVHSWNMVVDFGGLCSECGVSDRSYRLSEGHK